MAFGRHWEWRGFGSLQTEQWSRLQTLTPRPGSGHRLHDVYLWTPDCPTNIKLRAGDLKIKRILAKQEIYECWLEDEGEVYPFPLTSPVVAKLDEILRTHLSASGEVPLSRQQLSVLLEETEKEVRTIAVHKYRRQFFYEPGDGDGVIVEWTEITEPEPIITLSLEHPHVEPIQTALLALDLPTPALRTMNYLEALAYWADGKSIIADSR